MFKIKIQKIAKISLSFFALILLFSFIGGPQKPVKSQEKSSTNKKIVIDIGINQPNVEDCDPSAINEIYSLKHVQVFPNPSDGLFSLILSDYILANSSSLIVDVYSLNGNLVYSDNLNSINNSTKIDLSFLEAGMYFMQIHNSAISNYSKIIIK